MPFGPGGGLLFSARITLDLGFNGSSLPVDPVNGPRGTNRDAQEIMDLTPRISLVSESWDSHFQIVFVIFTFACRTHDEKNSTKGNEEAERGQGLYILYIYCYQ